MVRFFVLSLGFFFISAFAHAQTLDRDKIFSELLQDHVQDGHIAYKNLCQDSRLKQYLQILKEQKLDQLKTSSESLVFWLNAYHAYSLDIICQKYPIQSLVQLNPGGLVLAVMLKRSMWDKPFIKIDQQAFTLKQIDHEIIRSLSPDPRLQFAIACGAKGCPPSRGEAYHLDALEQQLDDSARQFITRAQYNQFDLEKRIAHLSPIFNWSRKLFGQNDREILLYIHNYLPQEIREDIKKNVEKWRIQFNKYDLSLDDSTAENLKNKENK